MKKWAIALCLSVAGVYVQADQPTMMNPMPVDCSALTGDEQVFASQLNVNNQLFFCQKFSPAQRNMAMQMAGQPDPTGNILSADAAVQKIVQDNNMMMPMTPAKTQGGCPVQ